jgi:hypothetical protein
MAVAPEPFRNRGTARGNAFLAFAIAVCLIGLRCGGGRLWSAFCER